MRAWEFLNEGGSRKPPITLWHLNNLKQERQWRAASHNRRIVRTRAMYANTNWQREQMELERMRLKTPGSRSLGSKGRWPLVGIKRGNAPLTSLIHFGKGPGRGGDLSFLKTPSGRGPGRLALRADPRSC